MDHKLLPTCVPWVEEVLVHLLAVVSRLSARVETSPTSSVFYHTPQKGDGPAGRGLSEEPAPCHTRENGTDGHFRRKHQKEFAREASSANR